MSDDDLDTHSPAAHIDPACPHCRQDLAVLIRKVESASWAAARRLFQSKAPRKPSRLSDSAELVDLRERVELLESGLIALLSKLFPGQAAPVPAAKKEEKP
jgi:hypothetical protein